MEIPTQSRPSGERSRPSRPPPPSTVAVIRDLRAVQKCYDDAYKHIDLGLSADERGNADEAKAIYQSGLQSVTRALGVNCEQLNGTQEDKDQAKSIQQKLNKTKLQIEYRLQALRASEIAIPTAPQTLHCDEPPSYEDATSFVPDAQYLSLGDSIMRQDSIDSSSLVANATEIFCIPDGAQIFFITPEGYVSAPSYPAALKVFKFNEDGASNTDRPSAFLQVADWLYPLQPGASPALQSNYGAYLFPDVASTQPGAAVGVMIPETVSVADRRLFEELLNTLTILQQQEVVASAPMETGEATQVEQRQEGETVSTSTKISKGLITAAEYISWGVGKGAEKASKLVRYGSEKLKTRITPEENPKNIDPKIQTGIRYARTGTHAAVQVSSYIVTKLGEATMYLAREAAPHIRRQGVKYLPESLKQSDSDGKSKLDGVLEVAASSLQGFGTVYMSLEQAAKALGKNLATETVGIVNHKYGFEASQVTENALYATGNIAMTAYNAENLGIKAVAKRAAKDTGKAVLEDMSEQRNKKQPEKPPLSGAGPSGNDKR